MCLSRAHQPASMPWSNGFSSHHVVYYTVKGQGDLKVVGLDSWPASSIVFFLWENPVLTGLLYLSCVVDLIRIRSPWCHGHCMPAWRSVSGCIEHNGSVLWTLSTTLPWGRVRPSPYTMSIFRLCRVKGLSLHRILIFIICGVTSAFACSAEDSSSRIYDLSPM